MTDTTTAAVYCRISRVSQRVEETKRYGVDRQEKICRQKAAEKGWTVPEDLVYKDNNLSASEFSKKARERYLEMLDDIPSGQFQALVIWAEDRITRQLLEAKELADLCAQYGIKLVIAGTELEYDLTDPWQEHAFMERAMDARKEILRMSRRVRAAMAEQAVTGERHPGGRRGFGFTGTGPRKVTPRQALAEQELIREAARRLLDGESIRSILADWKRRDIRTPGTADRPEGSRWRRASLKRMVLGPAIAGYRVHHGKLIEG